MNDTPLLDAVSDEIHETVDATVPGLLSRRAAVKRTAGISAGTAAALALGSMPVALAALSREAGAQTLSAGTASVLQFALLLENLESEFYKAVLGTSTGTGSAAVIAAFAPVRAQINALAEPTRTAVLNTFTLISSHEVSHVNFLRGALGSAAATYTPASFDFTGARGAGNGPFARAATDLQFLLLATQAFEDTGVRAYKGQAGNLLRDATFLTAALGIHSVEARHASRVRRIRRATNSAIDTIRYSGTIRGGTVTAAGAPTFSPAPDAAVVNTLNLIYGGATSEANVTQGGTDISSIAAAFGAANGATEAFDEPLTRAEVVSIVQQFVVATVA